MIIKSGIITLIFFITISNISLAGAWTLKKGRGFHKLSLRFLTAQKIYDSMGNKLSIPVFNDLTLDLYSEYGLTDELTLFGGWSVYKLTKIDSAEVYSLKDRVSGPGDGLIGVKLRLLQFDNSVVSILTSFGIPSGKSEPDGNLITGDGEFDQSIGIQIGYSLYPLPSYLNLFLKFSNRVNGFSDQVGYGFEAGYGLFKSLTFIVRINGLYSLKNGDHGKAGGFGVFANNSQFIAYSGELNYIITENLGLSAAYESGTAGRNIVSAPVISLGLFLTH